MIFRSWRLRLNRNVGLRILGIDRIVCVFGCVHRATVLTLLRAPMQCIRRLRLAFRRTAKISWPAGVLSSCDATLHSMQTGGSWSKVKGRRCVEVRSTPRSLPGLIERWLYVQSAQATEPNDVTADVISGYVRPSKCSQWHAPSCYSPLLVIYVFQVSSVWTHAKSCKSKMPSIGIRKQRRKTPAGRTTSSPTGSRNVFCSKTSCGAVGKPTVTVVRLEE